MELQVNSFEKACFSRQLEFDWMFCRITPLENNLPNIQFFTKKEKFDVNINSMPIVETNGIRKSKDNEMAVLATFPSKFSVLNMLKVIDNYP